MPARLAAVALALAVVATALSGCSAVQTISHIADGSAKPSAGQCWSAAPHVILNSAVWGSSAPVRCSERHDAYTYAVVTVPKNLTAHSWLDSASDGSVTPSVDTAALDACFDAQTGVYPTLDTEKQNRFAFVYYLPPVRAWLAGVRWVRCDYSLFRFGTTLYTPGFEALPATNETMIDRINTHGDEFGFCLNTSSSATVESDPLNDRDATYADCSSSPQWREVYNDYFPQGVANYPGEKVVTAFEEKACTGTAKSGELWIPYGPTAKTWDSGDREVECWVASLAVNG